MKNAINQLDLQRRFCASLRLGMISTLISIAFVALLVTAFADESWPVLQWQSVPPAERLFPEAALARVLAFAEEQNTRALLLVRGGRLEAEHYFGFDPILLAAVLQNAIGQPLDTDAKGKLFNPLGITTVVWEGDESGLINGGSQIALVRFGSEPKFTPSGQKFVPELLRRLLSTAP